MPSVKDTARFRAFQVIGCVACRQRGIYSQADVHHLLSGGRRRGHRATVPLCVWHHRGGTPDGMTAKDATWVYGPSLARGPKTFRAEFGDDEKLLRVTDAALAAIEYTGDVK